MRGALSLLDGDAVAPALVELLEGPARTVAARWLLDHPALALPALQARPAGRRKETEGFVLAAIQRAQASAATVEVGAPELPPSLAAPPWRRGGARRQPLVVVDVAPSSQAGEERFEWRADERERFAEAGGEWVTPEVALDGATLEVQRRTGWVRVSMASLVALPDEDEALRIWAGAPGRLFFALLHRGWIQTSDETWVKVLPRSPRSPRAPLQATLHIQPGMFIRDPEPVDQTLGDVVLEQVSREGVVEAAAGALAPVAFSELCRDLQLFRR